MKKMIVAVMLMVFSAQSFAQNLLNIHLTFNDNTTALYENIPDNTDFESFKARVKRDFPDKTHIKEATSTPVVQKIDGAQKATGSSNAGSNAGSIIGTLIVIAALAAVVRHTNVGSSAFPCVLPTDRARDGSLCGGRASSVRPGGR